MGEEETPPNTLPNLARRNREFAVGRTAVTPETILELSLREYDGRSAEITSLLSDWAFYLHLMRK
jgi:hypothetical protein